MEITTEAAKYSNQLFIDSRRQCPGTVTFFDFSKLPVVSDICIAFANLLRENAAIVAERIDLGASFCSYAAIAAGEVATFSVRLHVVELVAVGVVYINQITLFEFS